MVQLNYTTIFIVAIMLLIQMLSQPLAYAEGSKGNNEQELTTILLDINSADAPEDLVEAIYESIYEILETAGDLGQIIGKEALPMKYRRHALRSCGGIDNYNCLRKLANSVGAVYAVYGVFRSMDDLYFLHLEILDVETGHPVNVIKKPISIEKTNSEIVAISTDAACVMTKRYGCGESKPQKAAVILAPIVTPPAKAAKTTAQNTAQKPASSDALPAINMPVANSDDDDAYDDDIGDDDIDDDTDDAQIAPYAGLQTQSDIDLAVKKQYSPKKVKLFKITGWTLVATSLAAIAGGATTTALMYKAKSDYDNALPGEGQFARDSRDKAKQMQWASIGLYSVAGVCAAAGIPLLVLGYMNDSANAEVSGTWIMPSLTSEGYGLALGTSF